MVRHPPRPPRLGGIFVQHEKVRDCFQVLSGGRGGGKGRGLEMGNNPEMGENPGMLKSEFSVRAD